MTLATGSPLGPYEVLSPLGAGGMGEVYRARDTRLDRIVAVKVLREHVSSSLEVRQRFEREAKAIAALSHPHICALYDVGHEGNTEYLVMEYLEGETLADRIAGGVLPLPLTLRFGAEIASALDAAHRQGIAHRDLKPGNIMLTRAGVKLLDFGLAKILSPNRLVEGATGAITQVNDLTQEGTILGTLGYLAPEQIEGKGADARTDIFALGVVLYEMATGKKAFAGTSQVSLLSSVLTSEPPPISALKPASPPALDRLVQTCLAKDPAERWQSAHDVGLELGSIAAAVPPASGMRGAVGVGNHSWIPWLIVAIACGVAVAAFLHPRSAPVAPQVPVRFAVPPPEGGSFSYSAESDFFGPSPDGLQIAFIARGREGEPRIFLRPLSSAESRPLPGTEGAKSFFWSADSRSIAFSADDKLKRTEVSGSSGPVAICDLPRGVGVAGSWGATGDILYAGVQGDAIFHVRASGGVPEVAVKPSRGHGEFRVYWPKYLPDGRRFLYLSRGEEDPATLMYSEPGKPPRKVLRSQSFAEFVEPGFLVFANDGALLARRFDWRSGLAEGESFSLAPTVRTFRATAAASFSTSRTGVLVHQSRQDEMRLVWFDRGGREVATVGTPGRYLNVRLSPDEKTVLMDRAREGIGTLDIWSIDLERGTETQVTSDPGTEFAGVFLPGGKSIACSITRGRTPRLFRHDLATGSEQSLRPDNGKFQVPQEVSPDGRFLLFGEQNEAGTSDIWAYPLAGDGEPFPVLHSLASKTEARFSPDGKYLTFLSDESGRWEAYVTPFPGPGERIRVSTAGALHLRWSRDGREIFYLSADRHLMSVQVQTSPSLRLGTPTALFVWKGEVGRRGALERGQTSRFDVSADGQRFLVVAPEVVADELPLSVVLNWPAEIARSPL